MSRTKTYLSYLERRPLAGLGWVLLLAGGVIWLVAIGFYHGPPTVSELHYTAKVTNRNVTSSRSAYNAWIYVAANREIRRFGYSDDDPRYQDFVASFRNIDIGSSIVVNSFASNYRGENAWKIESQTGAWLFISSKEDARRETIATAEYRAVQTKWYSLCYVAFTVIFLWRQIHVMRSGKAERLASIPVETYVTAEGATYTNVIVYHASNTHYYLLVSYMFIIFIVSIGFGIAFMRDELLFQDAVSVVAYIPLLLAPHIALRVAPDTPRSEGRAV